MKTGFYFLVLVAGMWLSGGSLALAEDAPSRARAAELECLETDFALMPAWFETGLTMGGNQSDMVVALDLAPDTQAVRIHTKSLVSDILFLTHPEYAGSWKQTRSVYPELPSVRIVGLARQYDSLTEKVTIDVINTAGGVETRQLRWLREDIFSRR